MGWFFAAHFQPALEPAGWIWVHLSFSELPLIFSLGSKEQEWGKAAQWQNHCVQPVNADTREPPKGEWAAHFFLRTRPVMEGQKEIRRGCVAWCQWFSYTCWTEALLQSCLWFGEAQPTLSLPSPKCSFLVWAPLWSNSKPRTSSQTSATWEIWVCFSLSYEALIAYNTKAFQKRFWTNCSFFCYHYRQ